MADEGVGDALVSAEQHQVEGTAALHITLVKLVGQLQAMKGTELKSWDRYNVKKEYFHQRSVCTLPRLPPTHSSSFSFPCGDRG